MAHLGIIEIRTERVVSPDTMKEAARRVSLLLGQAGYGPAEVQVTYEEDNDH